MNNEADILWDESDEELSEDLEHINDGSNQVNDAPTPQPRLSIPDSDSESIQLKNDDHDLNSEPKTNTDDTIVNEIHGLHIDENADDKDVEESSEATPNVISDSINVEEAENQSTISQKSKEIEVPVQKILAHLITEDGRVSSLKSDGSFDIVRKESVQPIQKTGQASDEDDWEGWDDSPTSDK